MPRPSTVTSASGAVANTATAPGEIASTSGAGRSTNVPRSTRFGIDSVQLHASSHSRTQTSLGPSGGSSVCVRAGVNGPKRGSSQAGVSAQARAPRQGSFQTATVVASVSLMTIGTLSAFTVSAPPANTMRPTAGGAVSLSVVAVSTPVTVANRSFVGSAST
jgi:hypothetical protein